MDQANFPIEVIQGVSYLQPFYYFDEDGLPIDLTGCTARMQARQTVNAVDDPIFDWTTENGNISINGNAGCVLVSVSATDTAALEQLIDGVYSLLLTFPSTFVEQLIAGPINIVGEVTR